MANILLVGGLGFIGKNLTNRLIKDQHNLVVYDYLSYSNNNVNSSISYIQGELIDTKKIVSILKKYRIDIVFHLSSTLKPSSSFDDYMNEYNSIILPTYRLLTILAKENIKIIYFSSGGAVYGKGLNEPILEATPLKPINYYGHSKIVLEEAILLENRISGLEYTILRPSNPYGKGQNLYGRQGLIAVILGNIVQNKPVQIWGDGTIVRDYIYIDDLTNAISSLLGVNHSNHIYNIGSGEGYSINEILINIKEILGVDIDIKYFHERKIDSKYMILDITRLKNTITFTPNSLRDGINKFILDLKKDKII